MIRAQGEHNQRGLTVVVGPFLFMNQNRQNIFLLWKLRNRSFLQLLGFAPTRALRLCEEERRSNPDGSFLALHAWIASLRSQRREASVRLPETNYAACLA